MTPPALLSDGAAPLMRALLPRGGLAAVYTEGLTLRVTAGHHQVRGVLEDEVDMGHALLQLQRWLPRYSEDSVPSMARRLLESFAASDITIGIDQATP